MGEDNCFWYNTSFENVLLVKENMILLANHVQDTGKIMNRSWEDEDNGGNVKEVGYILPWKSVGTTPEGDYLTKRKKPVF